MGLFDFWKKKDTPSAPTPQPPVTPTQQSTDFGAPVNPTVQPGSVAGPTNPGNPPLGAPSGPTNPGAPVNPSPTMPGFENRTVDGINKVDGQGPTQPPQPQQ